MSRPEPWAKMWWDWYSQRSHVALSFDALHLGGLLLNLAKASPEQRWLLDDSGAAMSLRALAMVARMPGAPRVIERRMEAALQELADAGTMERREDGAWGFTEAAWKSQACASRDRTRAYRGRQKERHGDAGRDDPGDVGVTPHSDQRIRSQKIEEKKKKRSEPPPVTEVAPVEPLEDPAAVRMRGHYARLALRLQLHGAESLTDQQWAELRHLAAELGEDIPAERLAYLATVPGVAAYAPEQPGRHHGTQKADRRLAGHPSAREHYSEFPHPFEPAESTAPSGRTRVPAGEGSDERRTRA